MSDIKRVSVPLWMVQALADDDGSANWNAAALLARIVDAEADHSHDDQFWLVRTDEEWAAELGLSSKTISRLRRRLVEGDWIECRRMRCGSGSEVRSVMHLRCLPQARQIQ